MNEFKSIMLLFLVIILGGFGGLAYENYTKAQIEISRNQFKTDSLKIVGGCR